MTKSIEDSHEGILSPPTRVRLGTPQDAENIVRIHFAAVHGTACECYAPHVLETWSPPADAERAERVRQQISDGIELLVIAELAGTACGFGSIVGETKELRAVYVDPAFGRRGIGTLILEELEQRALQQHVRQLSMDASLNAEGFYRKNGYTVIRRGIHRFESGIEMTCVRMTKVL